MARIDIRLPDDKEITQIKFAEAADDEIERLDIAYCLNNDNHPLHIYMECSTGDYVTIRKSDVRNLIKALEKSLEIWCDK